MNSIFVVGGDPGGANALIPVIEALFHDSSFEVHTYAYNEACTLWKHRGLKFSALPDKFPDENIQEILQYNKPDLLLLSTSYNSKNFEKHFIKIAQEKKIPSISILDFWSFYSMRYNDHKGNLAYLPDVIAVMDEIAKDEMIKEGFDPVILKITGQPAYDDLINWKQEFNQKIKIRIRNNLGIHEEDIVVLFASEPDVDNGIGDPFYPGYKKSEIIQELIKTLIDINNNLKLNIILLIRPHPRENIRDYNQYAGFPLRIIVSAEDQPRNIVMSVDLVAGMTTNLLVEACYLGCIVVSLQPNLCLIDPVITNRLGYSVGVFNTKDFNSVIQKLLFDSKIRDEMKSRLETIHTDGKAVERIMNIIYSIIEKNKILPGDKYDSSCN